MKINVIGKNIKVTEALRDTVEKKLSKLDRFFNPNVVATATLSVERNKQNIEVTIPFNGVVLRGEESNGDMYASIDLVIGKLEGQIRKQKTKLQKRKYNDSLRFKYIPDRKQEEDDEPKIVKTKRFAMKPMSSEEAVLQMELVGHNFFVYKDADTEEVNVVYKRRDGDYGLIEPEF
ncbi:ribosome hibernation-promoting factor, HPF/YfiA family [Clostridium oceanicum]|uniref:Ribosome hibernation promoting factor n=1 Tax=Clostridium oceanicum TaxID=1543 RepID=A0ABN1JQ51_9CLOT